MSRPTRTFDGVGRLTRNKAVCQTVWPAPRRRTKIDPGSLLGHPMPPKSVQEVSRERLVPSPRRPRSARRVPKGAPGRQKERPGEPDSAPRRPKSTPDRVRERKKIEFLLRGALAKHSRSDFWSIVIDFQCCCNVSKPLKVLCLSAKMKVRPFVVRVERLA